MFEIFFVSTGAFALVNTVLWRGGSKRVFGNDYSLLPSGKQWSWNDRLVSTLHAVISAAGAVACFLSILADHDWSFVKLAHTSDVRYDAPAASIFMEITSGFFLYDMVQMWLGGAAKAPEYTHHVISLVLYLVMIAYGWALFIPIALQISELSTPMLHGAWFLMLIPRFKDGAWHLGMQVGFAVTFFIVRICFMGFVYGISWLVAISRWPTSVPGFLPIFCLVGFTLFYLVQWFWLYGIFRKIMTTGKKKPEERANPI